MAWPPGVLPINRTNAVPQNNTHPADHNAVNLAVNDIVTKITGDLELRGRFVLGGIAAGAIGPNLSLNTTTIQVPGFAGRPAVFLQHLLIRVSSPTEAARHQIVLLDPAATIIGEKFVHVPPGSGITDTFVFPVAALVVGQYTFQLRTDGSNSTTTITAIGHDHAGAAFTFY